jgi:hypothetical protein
MSKHSGLLIVGAVAALAVMARPAAAQAPKDPCTLLTPSQVAGALGVKDVAAGAPIGKTGCQWVSQDKALHAFVTLSFWDPAGFSAMKAPLPNVTKTPVRGVGDDALYSTIGQFTTLSVKKGGAVFLVKAYGVPDQAKQEAIEKTLAGDVIAKL